VDEMIREDLEHIFKPQLDQIKSSNIKLFFMLQDGDDILIERHPADDLDGLLPMLDNFHYNGSDGNIPRFVK
jgi:hypothetical protein